MYTPHEKDKGHTAKEDRYAVAFRGDIRRVRIYRTVRNIVGAVHIIRKSITHSEESDRELSALLERLFNASVLEDSLREHLSRDLLLLAGRLENARRMNLLSEEYHHHFDEKISALLEELSTYDGVRSRGGDEGGEDAPSPEKRRAPAKGQGHRAPVSLPARRVERGGEVMAIVRERKRVGIKDISRILTGVSEKTIQRELARLVARGELKRTGERRWSEYSLP